MKAHLHHALLHPLGEHGHQTPLLAGGCQPQREPSFTGIPETPSQMGEAPTAPGKLLVWNQETSLLLLNSQFGGEGLMLPSGRPQSV